MHQSDGSTQEHQQDSDKDLLGCLSQRIEHRVVVGHAGHMLEARSVHILNVI